MPLYTAPRISILGASSVGVSGPADTNENILATVTIPAGAMGLNGRLRINTLWTVNNNANVKAARVRLGGIGGTDFLGVNIVNSVSLQNHLMIANRNAANSQIGFVIGTTTPFSLSTSANVTAAIDTSAATTLVITAAKATAGDTMTLESYLVELILP